MEIEVDIEIGMQHVKVPISVNGQGPFSFTLDTGASVTTLSKKLTEQLGISTRKGSKSEAHSVGGGIPTEYADAEISMESLKFDKDEVYVLDLDAILRDACNREGVLGYSTLKLCMMSLSYNRQRFKLSRENSPHDLNWSPFVYIKESHLVGVPVHINGKGPYDFVLDTGAGNTVVTPEMAATIGLEAKPVHGIARGLGGDVELELAAVDAFSIGAASISHSQVVVLDLSKVSPKGKLIENGIIGYDFLKNFETVIDYPNKQFSFIDERSS